ncbi:MAG: hypothetical protein K1X94_36410 [Sandaracinaceae bacterium]|nr:hypothetical protein [Sandaracinaceae bacterium]
MSEVTEPAIYGAIILQTRVVLEEMIGPSAYREALSKLPPEDADRYAHANALDWVPIRIIEAVARAAGEATGRDWQLLNDEVSRVGSRRAFGTVWRVLLRFTSDEALMTRGPTLFGKTYNQGRVHAEFSGHGTARIALEWPGAPELVIRTLRVAIEEVLVAGGRTKVRVTVERNARGAAFHCLWSLER